MARSKSPELELVTTDEQLTKDAQMLFGGVGCNPNALAKVLNQIQVQDTANKLNNRTESNRKHEVA